MNLSRIIVDRPVTIVSSFVVFLIIAGYTIRFLAVDFLPEIEAPIFSVITSYTGASPEQVERLVSKPLEDLFVTLEGLDSIESNSSEGLSRITLEFQYGVDLEVGKNNIRDLLGRISVGSREVLPEGSTSPILYQLSTRDIPVLELYLRGINPNERFQYELQDIYSRSVESFIQRIEGVGGIFTSGDTEGIVLVEASLPLLQSHSLMLEDIAQRIILQNQLVSGGQVKGELQSFGVKTRSEFTALEDIGNVVIKSTEGVEVRVKDLADVRWSAEDPRAYVYLDGNAGMNISVQKRADANITEVSDAVKLVVDDLNESLRVTNGVEMVIVDDRSDFVRLIIREVFNTAYLGGIFAILVLFFFLRSFKAVIITGVAIPICFVFTLSALYFTGLTINMMSLVGLVLGIGMVLDNSIIVLEKIFALYQRGLKPNTAAFVGTQEIMMPVLTSTLTNVVVFAPVIIFSDQLGIYGQFFFPLCFTVIIAQSVSFITAIALVPALLGRLLQSSGQGRPQWKRITQWLMGGGGVGGAFALFVYFLKDSMDWIPSVWQLRYLLPVGLTLGLAGSLFFFYCGSSLNRIIERLLNMLTNSYEWLLRLALKTHYLFLLGLGGLVVLTSYVAMEPGFDVFPASPVESVSLSITFDPNTSIEVVNQVTLSLTEQALKDIQGHRHILSTVAPSTDLGFGNRSNRASLKVYLDLTGKEGVLSLEEVSQVLQGYMSDYPDLTYRVIQGGGRRGAQGDSPIELELSAFDYQNLTNFALQVENTMREHPEVFTNVRSDYEDGGSEYVLNLNREKLLSYGLDVLTINAAVANYLTGIRASEYRIDEDSYTILVRTAQQVRGDLGNLPFYTVRTGIGHFVQLQEIADIEVVPSQRSIRRENRQRSVGVRSSLESGINLQEGIALVEAIVTELQIPDDISYSFGGNQEEIERYGQVFIYLILFAFLLVFAIMASQFESLRDPFIVIFTVPFVFVGVIWMYVFAQTSYTLFTAVGVVMLMGLVVNNGIVYIDYANLLRKRGHLLKEAIVQAGKARLRPILMTSFTTIVGMLPLVFSEGQASGMLRSIGYAVLGGFTVSGMLTLIYVPIFYLLVNREPKAKSLTTSSTLNEEENSH